MISFLSRWKQRRSRPDASHLRFTVYSRDRCGCCHTALALLEEFQRRHHFAIEVVDIDNDPELVALYTTSVPVIALDGKVRFKGIVNPRLLERLIAAEARRE
ncbi:glutaredoxin family protein [Singulisphaera rosea]